MAGRMRSTVQRVLSLMKRKSECDGLNIIAIKSNEIKPLVEFVSLHASFTSIQRQILSSKSVWSFFASGYICV